MINRLGNPEIIADNFRRVINNLEKVKMVAESRLHNRLKRPGAEQNCDDKAQLA